MLALALLASPAFAQSSGEDAATSTGIGIGAAIILGVWVYFCVRWRQGRFRLGIGLSQESGSA